MPPEKTLKKPLHPALIAGIGFVAGIVLTLAWSFESHLQSGARTETTSTSSSAQSLPATAGLVSIRDQQAGDTVTVDSVQVPAPGVWVAVAEISDNQLGNVLGAARTLAPATNVAVHLLRNTVPGTTYAVVLYRDNGDGTFDPTSDSVYVDFATGDRVVALFKTIL